MKGVELSFLQEEGGGAQSHLVPGNEVSPFS